MIRQIFHPKNSTSRTVKEDFRKSVETTDYRSIFSRPTDIFIYISASQVGETLFIHIKLHLFSFWVVVSESIIKQAMCICFIFFSVYSFLPLCVCHPGWHLLPYLGSHSTSFDIYIYSLTSTIAIGQRRTYRKTCVGSLQLRKEVESEKKN